MSNYTDFLERAHAKWGDKFDASDLCEKFVPYYNSKRRIKVRVHTLDEVNFGTVGVTTGWRPSFILLHSSRSIGSSILLDNRDEILAVQSTSSGKYVNPGEAL